MNAWEAIAIGCATGLVVSFIGEIIISWWMDD